LGKLRFRVHPQVYILKFCEFIRAKKGGPKSVWGLIGVAVRDGGPILCEVGATPLGVLFRPVFTQKVQGKIKKSREIRENPRETPKLLSAWLGFMSERGVSPCGLFHPWA